MELLDLFLSPQHESDRIKRLSRQIASRSKREKANSALKRTRDDVGFLALSLLAIVRILEEKGLMTEREFLDRILSLDTMDGLADGKIEMDQLRRALGFAAGGAMRASAKRVPVAKEVAPQQPGRRKKKVRVKVKSRPRSRTVQFAEPEPAAAAEIPAPSAAPAMEMPSAPEPLKAPDLADVQIKGTAMDPSKLGEISYEDYFGAEKKT